MAKWQTRTVEGRVEQSMGVQVPPRAPFFLVFLLQGICNSRHGMYIPCSGLCFVFEEPGAHIAQLVEHILGKDEVTGSSPVVGSIFIINGLYILNK